jgi:hypothetical protein
MSAAMELHPSSAHSGTERIPITIADPVTVRAREVGTDEPAGTTLETVDGGCRSSLRGPERSQPLWAGRS